MAFQLVKHKMSGGCNLFELLYGRKFTLEELCSQPSREISTQCLIYDNELEQEFIRQQETKSKELEGKFVLGGKDINKLMYDYKWGHLADIIVTLLPREEYIKIAKSTDNN